MDSKRLRLILLGLLGGSAVLFMAICVIGLSTLSAKSQKMVDLKLQSKVLDDQISSLAQAKKQVQNYTYIKSVAAEVIPDDKNQAQAVLEIFQIASESGIAIQSISFPSSTLGAVTSASAASASSASIISQAKPVVGIKGLYSIQLTITPETGPQVPDAQQLTYAKMLDFFDRIERNQRTAQITQVNVQPQGGANGTSASAITFSITVNIFIKP